MIDKIKQPFLYLTTDEALKKINFKVPNNDPIQKEKLINIFKEAMIKFENYFQKNNLINVKDYSAFFEKYLLSDTPEKMSFEITDNIEKSISSNETIGMYDKNKNIIFLKNTIFNTLNKSSETNHLHTFIHEFTHFLVMHNPEVIDVYRYSCFNEALTEKFAAAVMNSEPNSYNIEIEFLDFFDTLFPNKNIISDFLKGKINFNKNFSNPSDLFNLNKLFENSQNYFINSIYMNDFSYHFAINNNDFIEMQRIAIDLYLKNIQMNTIDDFLNLTDILNNRIVIDEIYIENSLSPLISKLAKKISNENNTLVPSIEKILKDYLTTKNNLKKFNGREVASIIYNGKNMYIDSRHELHADDRYVLGFNPDYLEISMFGKVSEDDKNRKKFYYKDLHFSNNQELLDQRTQQLKKINSFSKKIQDLNIELNNTKNKENEIIRNDSISQYNILYSKFNKELKILNLERDISIYNNSLSNFIYGTNINKNNCINIDRQIFQNNFNINDSMKEIEILKKEISILSIEQPLGLKNTSQVLDEIKEKKNEIKKIEKDIQRFNDKINLLNSKKDIVNQYNINLNNSYDLSNNENSINKNR